MEEVRAGRYRVTVTNPERLLFPHDQITKKELVAYYVQMAPLMLPFLQGRLLTQQRFPEGIAHEGFYQKNIPDSYPAYIKRCTVARQTEGTVDYAVGSSVASLVYLVQMGCITFHTTLSQADALMKPDQLIFDLDPSRDHDFARVKQLAFTLREQLEADGLAPFAKLTGSRGVHVVVPLVRRYTFERVKAYAQQVAAQVVHMHPATATTILAKDQRAGRIFIDTLRNAYSATAVAPYAVRALAGAPVAAPVTWDELSTLTSPQQYTVRSMAQRIQEVGDVWADFFVSKRPLPPLQKPIK